MRIAWSASAALTETTAGTVVRSDLAAFHITGRDARAFVADVAPLLDGTRDLAGIQSALAEYSPRSVAALIDALSARGLVEEVNEGRGAESTKGSVFFRPLAKDPEAARAKLAAARVVFVGAASFVEPAMASIRAAGAGEVSRLETSTIEGAALLVGGIRPRDEQALVTASKGAHEAGIPSLWAHVAGRRLVLGPVVVPGQTACRVCLSTEVLNPVEGMKRDMMCEEKAGVGAARLLAEMVATAVIEIIVGDMPSRLAGRALSQDLRSWESSWRTLVRVPWCRVCG